MKRNDNSFMGKGFDAKGPVRCAVYTRKSTEEGLDQEFNSLDAQRESGESYIHAHKGEGWILVPEAYDDGGFSGGNTERPGLKRLLVDIEAGKIDVIVVYKVDRLTRSLTDFAQLVEVLDRKGVSFVSVTQHFNTRDSMGRLTLNILLTFAQFEREVIGERIRDKFSLSKKKGKFMGGHVPTGYYVSDRKLYPDPHYAPIIREIFELYLKNHSLTATCRILAEKGYRTPSRTTRAGDQFGGNPFSIKVIRYALRNRVYLGEVPHKGQWYPGEHDPLISQELWDQVSAIWQRSSLEKSRDTRAQTSGSPLAGRIFGPDGAALVPSSTRRRGRCYRYLVSSTAQRHGYKNAPVPPIAAGRIEEIVLSGMGNLLKAPEYVVEVERLLRMHVPDAMPSREELCQLLNNMGEVWEHLFPNERKRLFELLVERVNVSMEDITIQYRLNGLHSVLADIHRPETAEGWL
ncbi:recombinase family protein [Sansalvadorimonas sp. 2012CJ34-2]|uniref:Recombinase family protein n=1 Tax=Parendozoicomonas callyspongiae TaxID=2942213 RepID=A0ABT0PI73_9GAMM|nr:recombinase family protein [Sansalvadorimonas sp. 2012CJ34-2]MCL6271082.1 recombinase family protein [Sansalvadorimonas sp. 2012CJ34-2]